MLPPKNNHGYGLKRRWYKAIKDTRNHNKYINKQALLSTKILQFYGNSLKIKEQKENPKGKYKLLNIKPTSISDKNNLH